MNISQYNKRLQAKFQEEDLVCLEYKSMKLPTKIKCNSCGNVFYFKKGESPLKKEKQTMCKKCNLTPQQVKTRSKVEHWYNTIGRKDYELLGIKGYDSILLLCKHCNKEVSKGFHDLSIGKKCACQTTNTMISQEEFEKEVLNLFDGEYSVEGAYLGRHKPTLIRHECGFIWKTKPGNLLAGKGCPKCSKRESKGEKKVSEILTNHGVHFEQEKKVQIEDRFLYFDFFIPERATFIEFNGIQHYEPVKFFGGEAQFERQKVNDRAKEKFCKENGFNLLIIKYTDDITLNVQRLLVEPK